MISAADTLWVLVASAMVLLMTPALALFYGGLVDRPNLLSTKVHSFFAIGLVTLQWVVVGYSLAFSEGNAFIGGLDYAMFRGVGVQPGPLADTIPHMTYAGFQLMFAIITPAILSGSFAGRMSFRGYVLFTLLWTTLVYDPICHWVWGPGGWLQGLGALDFAGGTVVHVSSGVAGLAVALVLGPRRGLDGDEQPRPHNMGYVLLGAGMLWFGWFGFNAGSALSVGESAARAFMTTHLAAAAGAVSWPLVELWRKGRVSSLGVASGCVAGLVAITPACGFVDIPGAFFIGLGAGAVCYFGVLLKNVLGLDDALDAFGLHGVGGTYGALLTGVFAVSSIGGTAGALEGNVAILGVQALSVVATAVYSFGITWGIVQIVDLVVGVRVSEDQEVLGLDRTLHGEEGYVL